MMLKCKYLLEKNNDNIEVMVFDTTNPINIILVRLVGNFTTFATKQPSIINK